MIEAATPNNIFGYKLSHSKMEEIDHQVCVVSSFCIALFLLGIDKNNMAAKMHCISV